MRPSKEFVSDHVITIRRGPLLDSDLPGVAFIASQALLLENNRALLSGSSNALHKTAEGKLASTLLAWAVWTNVNPPACSSERT
jgi:hypothetical protein